MTSSRAQHDAVLRQHHGGELDVEADLEHARHSSSGFSAASASAGRDLVRRQTGGEQAGAVA